ncbi:T9SS type A sorting domain-containing protein [bacterium]|nr:T9SS type A sorting domain-containing protein [bacterium]
MKNSILIFIILLSTTWLSAQSIDTMTDQNGNIVPIVKIGSYWWMQENLKVTTFRNGDAIPNVTADAAWASMTSAAYCAYDNNPAYISDYGLLYNQYAAHDSRNIAPEGWSLPDNIDYSYIFNTAYPPLATAQIRICEAGVTYWNNGSATNESGFSARGAGYRFFDGSFSAMKTTTLFWMDTHIWAVNVSVTSEPTGTYTADHPGKNFEIPDFSIRLIKDPGPNVHTEEATSLNPTSATSGGTVTYENESAVTARGVCWKTSANPTIADNVTTDGSGAGSYTSSLTGLTEGTTYYVRSYATNTEGTSYGEEKTFSTPYSISFTNGSSFTPNITLGNSDQIVGQFKMEAPQWEIYFDAVTIQLNGSRTGYNNFKLFSENQVGLYQMGTTVTVDPGQGESITFTGFSDEEIDVGFPQTFYLRCDVAAGATGAIQGVIVDNSCLTFRNGALSSALSNAVLSDVDVSLPVQLSSFTANHTPTGVLLEWTTQSETDNLGFILERAPVEMPLLASQSWQTIATYRTHQSLAGQGNSSERHTYSYLDKNSQQGQNYKYRLSDVNTAGEINIYDTITIIMPDSPGETILEPPFPNPFNPETKIQYQLSKAGSVEIVVYNLMGRHVKTLINRHQSAGSHNIYWHGRDEAGNHSSTGTYVIVLKTLEGKRTQKVVMMR